MNLISTSSGHSGKMCFRYLLIGVSYLLRKGGGGVGFYCARAAARAARSENASALHSQIPPAFTVDAGRENTDESEFPAVVALERDVASDLMRLPRTEQRIVGFLEAPLQALGLQQPLLLMRRAYSLSIQSSGIGRRCLQSRRSTGKRELRDNDEEGGKHGRSEDDR